MAFKLLQSSKDCLPMLFIPSGIFNVFKPVQPEKASSPMLVRLLLKATSFSPVQPSNRLALIEVTAFGRLMEDRLLQ